jgi:hypothetical protein
MAQQRVLNTGKAGIAALIALLLAGVLFCAWVLSVLVLDQAGDILPAPSPSVTTPAPASPSVPPGLAPGTTQPTGPQDADARIDVPQQG